MIGGFDQVLFGFLLLLKSRGQAKDMLLAVLGRVRAGGLRSIFEAQL